jgi:predicted XRE-type DNA-binding protein
MQIRVLNQRIATRRRNRLRHQNKSACLQLWGRRFRLPLCLQAILLRNVFKDLGVPNADEHMVKAQLVFKIDGIVKERRLKQVETADLFGIRQPDVSKMLRGDFRQFSVERLLRFLVALDQDVEIVVKPHRGRNNAPALHVS